MIDVNAAMPVLVFCAAVILFGFGIIGIARAYFSDHGGNDDE